MKLIKKYS